MLIVARHATRTSQPSPTQPLFYVLPAGGAHALLSPDDVVPMFGPLSDLIDGTLIARIIYEYEEIRRGKEYTNFTAPETLLSL